MICGIFAYLVYNSAKDKNVDAGFWALIGLFGLIAYLIVASIKTEYNDKQHITPQYQRYLETERSKKADQKKQNNWNNKIFRSRGIEDTKIHEVLSLNELKNIYNMFKVTDPKLLDVLPINHVILLDNDYYREGYLLGLLQLISKKDIDNPENKWKKYSTL